MWRELSSNEKILRRVSNLPEFEKYRDNELFREKREGENSFKDLILSHWDLSDGSLASGLCIIKYAAEILFLAKAFPKELPTLRAPDMEG
jgi:hypothetical protein